MEPHHTIWGGVEPGFFHESDSDSSQDEGASHKKIGGWAPWKGAKLAKECRLNDERKANQQKLYSECGKANQQKLYSECGKEIGKSPLAGEVLMPMPFQARRFQEIGKSPLAGEVLMPMPFQASRFQEIGKSPLVGEVLMPMPFQASRLQGQQLADEVRKYPLPDPTTLSSGLLSCEARKSNDGGGGAVCIQEIGTSFFFGDAPETSGLKDAESASTSAGASDVGNDHKDSVSDNEEQKTTVGRDSQALLRNPLCKGIDQEMHIAGACRPCKFVYETVGCRNGQDCDFCHLPHQKDLRMPCRVKRRHCKGMLRWLREVHGNDSRNWPVSVEALCSKSEYMRELLNRFPGHVPGEPHRHAMAA